MPVEKSKTVHEDIAFQLGRVARALEREHSFRRRFIAGLMTGVGTALGATFIGAIVLLILSQIFKFFGLELPRLN